MIRRSSIIFQGMEYTTKVTATLIAFSMWFEVTPMPKDEWEITVKHEDCSRLCRVYEQLMDQEDLDRRYGREGDCSICGLPRNVCPGKTPCPTRR